MAEEPKGGAKVEAREGKARKRAREGKVGWETIAPAVEKAATSKGSETVVQAAL